jgi:hypothetical protein
MSTIEKLIELLKARRSIRAFKSIPLPEGYLGQIIEAARWSPSGVGGGERTLNSGLASVFLCLHLAARSLSLGSQWISK